MEELKTTLRRTAALRLAAGTIVLAGWLYVTLVVAELRYGSSSVDLAGTVVLVFPAASGLLVVVDLLTARAMVAAQRGSQGPGGELATACLVVATSIGLILTLTSLTRGIGMTWPTLRWAWVARLLTPFLGTGLFLRTSARALGGAPRIAGGQWMHLGLAAATVGWVFIIPPPHRLASAMASLLCGVLHGATEFAFALAAYRAAAPRP